MQIGDIAIEWRRECGARVRDVRAIQHFLHRRMFSVVLQNIPIGRRNESFFTCFIVCNRRHWSSGVFLQQTPHNIKSF